MMLKLLMQANKALSLLPTEKDPLAKMLAARTTVVLSNSRIVGFKASLI